MREWDYLVTVGNQIIKRTCSDTVLTKLLDKIKDQEYKVWELVEENKPKIKCKCTFNFDEEYFLLDKPFGKYKNKNSLKGCKNINLIYDELCNMVTDMETIGHRFIEGECLDELLD